MGADRAARPSIGWAWYGLAALILVSLIGNLIKYMIILVSEPIKLSLSLSDTQIGSLNGLALTLTTAIAAIPMGWLADKVDRRWLLAISVAVWSVATAAFGLATTFPLMFAFAMGIALGEAVLGPITYAMIPDMFPRDKWINANFIFYIAVLLGFAAANWASGLLLAWLDGHRIGLPAVFAGLESWRVAMILCALAGPLLIVMLLAMRLRPLAPQVAVQGDVEGVMAYCRAHARTIIGVFIGFGLSYAAYGAQGAWIPVTLQRSFGETPATVGQTLGQISMVAALAGVGTSWLAVRWLRPRFGDHAPMLVAQGGLLIGLLVSCGLPFVQTAAHLYAIIGVKTVFTIVAMSLSPAVLQFIAPAHMRGRVVAVGGMVTIIFGSILPPFIGFLSDSYFHGPSGILHALSVVVIPAFFIGLIVLRWGSKTLPATIAAASGGDD
ncbi:MFS transporter [Sandaracinobacteroides saxicola]|uniref:MFS transporter n=1 Tax=Sandaracinobacteroides saxicola TaxID=2759707 RepID=A0A7G5IKA0_9SPHN|nr:MFS transporter [Sandaracinobacteroides saxicola]QMW23792.1 MFS transporter [Sandaracinobacteroides saxicola]